MNEKLYRAINEIDVVVDMEAKYGPITDTSPKEVVLELLGRQAGKQAFKDVPLSEANDTTFSMDLESYLKIVRDLGFIEVYKANFPHLSSKGEAEDYEETQYVLANPEIGAVLNFDTYSYRKENGELVVGRNSAEVRYCWTPHDFDNYPVYALSSGSWESKTDLEWGLYSHDIVWDPNMFWFGHHDAREGLHYTLKKLVESGTLLPVWPKMRNPYWRVFINWADWKICEYKVMGAAASVAIATRNKERYKTTTDWFKAMTGHNIKD